MENGGDPTSQSRSLYIQRSYLPIRTCIQHETERDREGIREREHLLDEVVLKNTHENGSEEARQQQHSDTGVDNGEPVDLKVVRKGGCLGVLLHAAFIWDGCFLPLN
jgi:hypothetical protein